MGRDQGDLKSDQNRLPRRPWEIGNCAWERIWQFDSQCSFAEIIQLDSSNRILRLSDFITTKAQTYGQKDQNREPTPQFQPPKPDRSDGPLTLPYQVDHVTYNQLKKYSLWVNAEAWKALTDNWPRFCLPCRKRIQKRNLQVIHYLLLLRYWYFLNEVKAVQKRKDFLHHMPTHRKAFQTKWRHWQHHEYMHPEPPSHIWDIWIISVTFWQWLINKIKVSALQMMNCPI